MPSVLIECGHWPDKGGAPGEAEWAHVLGGLLAERLRAAGIDVTVVGSWYQAAPPPEARRPYSLSLHLHYDSTTKDGSHVTGCLADRAKGDPMAPESDRFIRTWEGIYPILTGIRLANYRRNAKTWDYYAFRATSPKTPGVLIEHGCGSPVAKDGHPPGADAPLLHGQPGLIAAADARAVLEFFGIERPVPIVLPEPTPQPEEANFAMLTDEELDRVAAAAWGIAAPYNPALAICVAWRDEWKAGRYRGTPLTPELEVPHRAEGDDAVWQLFTLGLAVYRAGQVSWAG